MHRIMEIMNTAKYKLLREAVRKEIKSILREIKDAKMEVMIMVKDIKFLARISEPQYQADLDKRKRRSEMGLVRFEFSADPEPRTQWRSFADFSDEDLRRKEIDRRDEVERMYQLSQAEYRFEQQKKRKNEAEESYNKEYRKRSGLGYWSKTAPVQPTVTPENVQGTFTPHDMGVDPDEVY